MNLVIDEIPLVQARNVHKSFEQPEVLKGIDLDVMPGDVVVILGPSGSGKSTFLRGVPPVLPDMSASLI